MDGQSTKSSQKMSPDSGNAIFSPVSPGGQKPCDSPSGQQTDLFGQVHALANRSACPGKGKGCQTNGISGQSLIDSLSSADLQLFLVSRLRALPALIGSELYGMTWKSRDISSALPICVLQKSANDTYDKEFTGPQSGNSDRSRTGFNMPYNIRCGRHPVITVTLPGVVELAGFPTVRSGNGGTGHRSQGKNPRGRLEAVVIVDGLQDADSRTNKRQVPGNGCTGRAIHTTRTRGRKYQVTLTTISKIAALARPQRGQ